jgi:glutaredoxin
MSGPKLAIGLVVLSAGMLALTLVAGPDPARRALAGALPEGAQATVQELAAGLGAAAAPAPGKTLFQYTDAKGAVRFVPRLEDVPPALRERAGRVELGDATAASVAPPPARAAARPAPAAARARARAGAAAAPAEDELPAWRRFDSVVIYTASWCGYCKSALEDLEERGVDYVRKEIDTNIDAKAELKERTGDTSVPQLFADGRRVVGYSRQGYDALFGTRR